MELSIYIPYLNAIFLGIWSIVLGFGIYKHIINVKEGKVSKVENNLLIYFFLMYFFAFLLMYYFNFISYGYFLEEYVKYIGYIIQIVAIIFGFWAISSYKEFWAFSLVKYIDHKVISSGPNSIVRHPFYLSNFLFFLGFSLSLRTLLSLTGAFVALVIIIYMIDIEEKFNLENIGEEYKKYMEKVKYRLIPFIY